MSESFRSVMTRLESAQKGAARSAPAYSRFVNRRIGRYLAAWAFGRGLSPNQVTGMSALFTFAGIILLATVSPSWPVGICVSVLFVIGYAFDSADGQVARLTGTGTPVGEWLDHVVDATKVSAQPLALAIGFFRFDTVPTWWLLVPLANAVAGAVLFFAMILTEQLRRAHGVTSSAPTDGRMPWLRSVLVLPTDYGVLCLSFLLLGATTAFAWIYTLLTAAMLGFLALATRKWFAEIAALGRLAR